jgi:hypothetical protein
MIAEAHSICPSATYRRPSIRGETRAGRVSLSAFGIAAKHHGKELTRRQMPVDITLILCDKLSCMSHQRGALLTNY